MRELRSIERRASVEGRWEFSGLMSEAQNMLERNNRIRAMEVWTRACATFPSLAMQSASALDFLVRSQCFDEAEELMIRAKKKYPAVAHPLEGLALVAFGRKDWEEAVRRCEVLRKRHPLNEKSYWIAAASLSELGRTEQADAMLARGHRALPEQDSLRIEYARLADRRMDWAESFKRWTEVHQIYGHIAGAAGAANALAELRRFGEAEQLLSSVMYKASNELTVWIAYARISEFKSNWEEAVVRWEDVRKRFPTVPLVYIHGLRPLFELGREAQAEDVLRESMERIRDDPAASVELARLADRRGDRIEATRRWTVVRQRFPEYRESS